MISINVNNVKLSLCTCRATNTWQPGGGGGLSTQQCLHFECSNRFGHILTYCTFKKALLPLTAIVHMRTEFKILSKMQFLR